MNHLNSHAKRRVQHWQFLTQYFTTILKEVYILFSSDACSFPRHMTLLTTVQMTAVFLMYSEYYVVYYILPIN
jgi:hypothetical protein